MTTLPAASDDDSSPRPAWSIRPVAPADADALGRLQAHCWRTGYAGLIDAGYLAGLQDAAFISRWRGWLSRPEPDRRTYLAETSTDQVAVGFVGVSHQGDQARLDALYVHDHLWGAGVGFALHRAGLDWLIANGCRRARLWVLSSNERAARFYRRQGWTSSGATMIDDRGSVQLAEAEMTMELPTPAGTGDQSPATR